MKGIYIFKLDLIQFTRNHWVLSFSLLFTVVASGFLLYGSSYDASYDGFNHSVMSLLNANLLLLPLVILLMGTLTLSHERETGWLSLVHAYPVRDSLYVIARTAALIVMTVCVLAIGYAVSALLGFLFGTTLPFMDFVYLLLFSLFLIFLLSPLAVCIGFLSSTKFGGLIFGLVVWAILTLAYDFLLISMMPLIPPAFLNELLTLLVALNPVQLTRVLTIMVLDGGIIFGPSLYEFTLFLNSTLGIVIMTGVGLCWLIVPTLLGIMTIKRRR